MDFEDTEFQKWLELQEGGLLWVQGKAGSLPSEPFRTPILNYEAVRYLTNN